MMHLLMYRMIETISAAKENQEEDKCGQVLIEENSLPVFLQITISAYS